MTEPENTNPTVPTEPNVPATPPTVPSPPTEPANTSVRNPERLLELFNQQKEELATLKKYKTDRDTELSVIEQDRLKKEQQYEALIPLKIEEALKPYTEKLTAYESEKVTLSNKLLEAESKYQTLQDSLTSASLKDSLYSEFVKSEGDPATSKESLWKLYGDQATITEGKISDLPGLIKTIQEDSFGAKLFIAKVPNGSATPPQTKAGVTKTETDKPRSVTKAMLLNPRKHGINTADIISGKIVVEG